MFYCHRVTWVDRPALLFVRLFRTNKRRLAVLLVFRIQVPCSRIDRVIDLWRGEDRETIDRSFPQLVALHHHTCGATTTYNVISVASSGVRTVKTRINSRQDTINFHFTSPEKKLGCNKDSCKVIGFHKDKSAWQGVCTPRRYWREGLLKTKSYYFVIIDRSSPPPLNHSVSEHAQQQWIVV